MSHAMCVGHQLGLVNKIKVVLTVLTNTWVVAMHNIARNVTVLENWSLCVLLGEIERVDWGEGRRGGGD